MLYVANYRTDTIRDRSDTRFRLGQVNGKSVVLEVDGRPTTEPDLVGRFVVSEMGRIVENGEADVLYRNQGGGRFVAVPFTGGAFLDEDGKPLASPPYDWGLSVMFRDLNGDGAPDLYVCNAGVQASGWTWCPVLLDMDLDGYEDLLFSTGHEWDMMNADVINQAEALKAQRKLSPLEILRLRTLFARFNTPKVIFRNRGNLTFEDVSPAWGFTAAEVSQGIALADLDNDGDLDVVMNNLNGQVALYRNDPVTMPCVCLPPAA